MSVFVQDRSFSLLSVFAGDFHHPPELGQGRFLQLDFRMPGLRVQGDPDSSPSTWVLCGAVMDSAGTYTLQSSRRISLAGQSPSLLESFRGKGFLFARCEAGDLAFQDLHLGRTGIFHGLRKFLKIPTPIWRAASRSVLSLDESPLLPTG